MSWDLLREKLFKYRTILTYTGFLFLVLSYLTLLFMGLIGEKIERVNFQYLSEIARASAVEVDTKISTDRMLLDSVASILRYHPAEGVEKMASVLPKTMQSDFQWIAYVDEKGRGYGGGIDGHDLSSENFFISCKAGVGGVRFCKDDDLGPVGSVVHSVPMVYGGGKTGAIVGVQSLSTFVQVAGRRNFSGKGFLNIISDKGEVLLATGKNPPEIQNLVTDLALDPEKKAKLSAALDSGRSGVLEFSRGAVSMLMAYEALGSSDWYVTTTVARDVINGETNYILYPVFFLCVGAMLLLLAVFLFVTLRLRGLKERMEEIAFVDELTGGHNVSKFKLLATQRLTKHDNKTLLLVRIDVKSFKTVNDMYGFSEGDRLLQSLYSALSSQLGPEDLFARMGNDNFVILGNFETIEAFYAYMQCCYEEFLSIHPTEYHYKVSFHKGLCPVKKGETDISLLLEKVSAALKKAKESGDTSAFVYDDTLREEAIRRKTIEDCMHEALAAGEFVVYLQPKYRLKTQLISGAEALIRWQKPDGTMIQPLEFIPLFEENGFVAQIDSFVLEETCRLQRKWIDGGREPVTISVNQSRRLVASDDYVERVAQIAARYQIPPHLIELELTETTIHHNIHLLAQVTSRLRELGFGVAIDDFGSGYSSLNVLKDISVDVLKIDREFLNTAETNAKGRAILSNIIKMAKTLDMSVVTEGVETLAQAALLEGMDCDTAQGFLFARPMPVADFESYLSVKAAG